MAETARYAVYYAPPEAHALARAGTRWLGRDAASGQTLAQPAFRGMSSARLAELTLSARRYGLHGTLKPPFELAEACGLMQLDEALIALASAQQAFDFEVGIARLADFFAWRPLDEHARIAALAARCLEALDRFRRLPDEAELARRRANGLSPRQDELLQRWGYPYVLDEFRFHLTLTDRVRDKEIDRVQALLEAGGAGRSCRLPFDSLCLFMEPAPGADFRLIARYGFDGRRLQYPG